MKQFLAAGASGSRPHPGRTLALVLLLGVPALLSAQPNQRLPHGREIVFPDIPGYLSLKCDFHTHSVFSDGSVWPDIRIEEAIRDGLDALSLTEHLEYQPHEDDIPHPDRNRAHQIGLELLEEARAAQAEGADLILVQGSEVTRRMPPGHANAIFIEDSNKLLIDDPIEVFREARRQGAFVFWNHPNWVGQRPDGVAALDAMHRRLIEEGLIHGIEVVNDWTYSDEAMQIALDEELTIMGTSDIHGLVDWRYSIDQGGHRPITLVFARERSESAIKDALFAGRTVAWFDYLLVGKSEYLVPLIEASLLVDGASYSRDRTVLGVWIENRSSATYVLRNLGPHEIHNKSDVLEIEGHSRAHLQLHTPSQLDSTELELEVLNALTAPKEYARIRVSVGGIERRE